MGGEGAREKVGAGCLAQRWGSSFGTMRVMTETSRLLRRTATRSERLLWQALRNRQLAGTKWRRQQKMGRFVVDFFCAEHRLVVEIDGAVHEGKEDIDAQRQEALERSGVRFARFTASEVENDLPNVLQRLERLMRSPSPSESIACSCAMGEGAHGRRE